MRPNKKATTRKQRSRRNAIIRITLNLIGMLCLIFLIRSIGITQLLSSLQRFKYWFPLIIFIGFAWFLCQAGAWSMIQNSLSGHIPFWTFFRMKVCSDALNSILPSANVGGDATRAYLLGRRVSLRQAIPGVLVDKTLEFVGGMLFMAVGILISLIFFHLPPALKQPSYLCMGLTIIGLAALIFIQRRGLYPALAAVTRIWPRLNHKINARKPQLMEVDANLRFLYTHAKWKLISAGGLYLFSRFMGALEVFIILRVLKIPVDLIATVFITAMVTVINTIFFMIPGQWGASEGAHVLILQALGFPAGSGLGVGVIRRIRKLVFAPLGLFFLNLEKSASDPRRNP